MGKFFVFRDAGPDFFNTMFHLTLYHKVFDAPFPSRLIGSFDFQELYFSS